MEWRDDSGAGLSALTTRPLAAILLVFTLGILAARSLPLPTALLHEAQWLIGAVLLILAALALVNRAHFVLGTVICGGALVAATGYLLAALQIAAALEAPLLSAVREQTAASGRQRASYELQGRVAGIPRVQRGQLRLLLRVDRISVLSERDPQAPEGTPRGRETLYEGPAGTCIAYVRVGDRPPPELLPGDTVRLEASLAEAQRPPNRGQFDYRAYLLTRGTLLSAYSEPWQVRRLNRTHLWPWPIVAKLRATLAARLGAALEPHEAQLALSVAFGDKVADLPEETYETFRRAGLTHILVASGTQISLIISLLLLFVWRPGSGMPVSLPMSALQLVLIVGVVLLYGAVAGFETSITRALIMGVVGLGGKLALREVDGLSALALSGVVLLLVNPLEAWSAGFQLSFVATFGLIYFAARALPLAASLGWLDGAEPDATRPARLAAWLRRALIYAACGTGGAQLFVTPLLASQFHQLSLLSLLSNLIALPISFATLVGASLVSLGAGGLPLLGPACGWALAQLVHALDGVARAFAALPASNLAIAAPPWWPLAAYILILAGCEAPALLGRLAQGERSILLRSLAALALIVLAAPILTAQAWRPALTALALPGGEAWLIRRPRGHDTLIARVSGLDRRHNGDTIADCLRAQGISGVDETFVIGSVAPPDLPQLIPLGLGRVALAGASDPPRGCGWLLHDGQCYGLEAQLGEQRAWVVWERPGRGWDATDNTDASAAVVLLTDAVWRSAEKTLSFRLPLGQSVCVIDAQARPGLNAATASGGVNVVRCGSQTRCVGSATGIKLAANIPGGP